MDFRPNRITTTRLLDPVVARSGVFNADWSAAGVGQPVKPCSLLMGDCAAGRSRKPQGLVQQSSVADTVFASDSLKDAKGWQTWNANAPSTQLAI